MDTCDIARHFIPVLLPCQQELSPNTNTFDELKNSGAVIVISPHPDDDVIGMGGLLGLMAGHKKVVCIYITDGAGSLRPDPPERVIWLRQQEACTAIRRIGLTGSFFLFAKSSWLSDQSQAEYLKIRQILQAIFVWICPQEIYVTAPFEAHLTHLRCTELVLQILRSIVSELPQGFQLWGYPVWGPLIGDTKSIRHVAIDSTIYIKAEAITAHAGEIGYKAYHEGVLARNRYQAVFQDAHSQANSQYMEIFLDMTTMLFEDAHISLFEFAQKQTNQYLLKIYPPQINSKPNIF